MSPEWFLFIFKAVRSPGERSLFSNPPPGYDKQGDTDDVMVSVQQTTDISGRYFGEQVGVLNG